MINILYTLSEKYENRDVYIWDVNKDAMTAFTGLAFRNVSIKGFVTLKKEFVGQSFVNRKIVGPEYLKDKKNVLIIASDNCDIVQIKYESISKDIEIIPYSKALNLNRKLKHEKIIVYGTGKRGDELFHTLTEKHISIDFFCLSVKGDEDFFNDIPVVAFDDIKEKDKYSIIIAVEKEIYKIEIMKKLLASDIGSIYLEEITGSFFSQEVFFPAINEALINNKKIYLYGRRDQVSKFFEEVLKNYQIYIDEYVDNEKQPEQNIGCVYDLRNINLSNVFVIICEIDSVRLQKMCEALDEMGFSLESFNYTALRRTIVDHKYATCHANDILVGEGILVKEEFPGYFVYGNSDTTDLKILVLGNSTSADGVFRPQCWSKYLYEKLMEENYKASIYNCAYLGYDVVHELLHLIRDGASIKPDIVISMSGLNNTFAKEGIENQFNIPIHMDWLKALHYNRKIISGLKVEERLCDFWYRIERMLRAISEVYGARFYGFLQPMYLSKENMNLFETSVFQEEKRQIPIRHFRDCAGNMPEIINLMSIFNDEKEMFIDFVHNSDKANKILANIVYGYMAEDIKELCKTKY